MTSEKVEKGADTPDYMKRFTKRNAGTKACGNCGRRTWLDRWLNQAGYCAECYALCGQENFFRDTGREAEADEVLKKFNARYAMFGPPSKEVP